MILTTSNCDSIFFNSDLFQEANNSLFGINPVVEIRIKGSINCCGEKFNKLVLPPINYLPKTADTVLPSDFDPMWTKFEGGVYGITLELKYQNGTIKIDSGCIFIPCEITCQIVSEILKDFKSDIYLKYDILLKAGNCGDCNCDRMCALFEELKKELPKKAKVCCKKKKQCKCDHDCDCYPKLPGLEYNECPSDCDCQGKPLITYEKPCSTC